MAAEIPLLSKIDVGNDEIVHKDDQPTFRHKNTLPYKGLLSNYRKTGQKGFITTNGNKVSFESSYSPKILYTENDNIFYKVTEDISEPLYTVQQMTKDITSSDLYLEKAIIVNGYVDCLY